MLFIGLTGWFFLLYVDFICWLSYKVASKKGITLSVTQLEKNFKQICKVEIIAGILTAIVSLMVPFIIDIPVEDGILGVIFGFTPLLLPLFHIWRKKEKIKSDEKTRLRFISEGKWKFPEELFWDKCKRNKATDVADKYQLLKIRKIAEELLVENNIPKEYHPIYISDNKILQYVSNCEKNDQEKEKRVAEELKAQKKARELAYKIPQDAKLNSEENRLVSFHSKLKNLKYEDKRIEYLNHLINETQIALNVICRDIDSINKGTQAMISSAYQEKTYDWSILGGIASGIAGPVAGAMVAGQAIQENQRIEMQNAENRAHIASVAGQIYTSDTYFSKLKKKESLENILKELQSQLGDISIKIIDKDVSLDSLLNVLSIEVQPNSKKQKVVKFKVKYTCNAQQEFSKTYKMAIDGTILVKAYCDNIFVDEVYVPLPLDGVAVGETKSEQGYLTKYMLDGSKRNYRFEVVPNALWLIER